MARSFHLFGKSQASRRRLRREMSFEGISLEPRRYLTGGMAAPVAEIGPAAAGTMTGANPGTDQDPTPPADTGPVTIPPLLGDVSW